MLERSHKIAIIGAGMTGLTAADVLSKSGIDVQVFDKGRVRGGRISTRRTAHGLFDHGAPAIDVKGSDFRQFLTELGAQQDDAGRLYGTPGMRSLFDGLGGGLPVRQEVRIARVEKEDQGWVLCTEGGRSFAHFDEVIVTVPAPQASDLVARCDPNLSSEIAAIRMLPVWTCLVEFEQPLSGFDVPMNGPILRADMMGRKPGRDDKRSAWVIHMDRAFTEENLHTDPAMIAPFILQTFAEACRIKLPGVVYLNAHRWRYAFADQPLGRPFLESTEPGLLVGGDWTLGRRAEDGFESGRAMAKSVLSRVTSPV